MRTHLLDLPRSVTSAKILLGLGAEQGVAPEVLLSDTGIAAAVLDDPLAEVTGAQELRLIRNLVAVSGDVPGFGLIAGARYHVTTHGVLGLMLMSCPTVGEAVTMLVRYYDLSYSYSVLSAEYTEDEVVFVFDDSAVPFEVRQFLLERDLVALFAASSSLVPSGLDPRRMEVALPEPAHSDLYRAFGVEPVFNAPRNLVTVPAAMLTLPLMQADPVAAAIAEQQCAALLNRRRERVGTSGAVRDLLLRTRKFTTEQDEVASTLAMSVRTLRRRLAEEGTSYRELATETAGLLAEELLGAGLTVEEVARRLGYTGAPAFTVAFKKWKGVTPGAFARSSRART